MKVIVGTFNQEKALVGAFSVIIQLLRLIVCSTTLDAGCCMRLVSGYQEVRLGIKTSRSWLLLVAALAPHYHRHRQAPAPGCWAGRVRNHAPAQPGPVAVVLQTPRSDVVSWLYMDSGNSDIRTSGVLAAKISLSTCLCLYVPKTVIGCWNYHIINDQMSVQ